MENHPLRMIGILCLVASAGAVGSLLRYGVSTLMRRSLGTEFPWGTLTVNLVGCFVFGLIASWADGRWGMSPQVRLVLLTGFAGAFTTFSTFAYETADLLDHFRWKLALANVVVQTALGLAMVFLGLAAGGWLSTLSKTPLE